MPRSYLNASRQLKIISGSFSGLKKGLLPTGILQGRWDNLSLHTSVEVYSYGSVCLGNRRRKPIKNIRQGREKNLLVNSVY